jgi:hypothetical protein
VELDERDTRGGEGEGIGEDTSCGLYSGPYAFGGRLSAGVGADLFLVWALRPV